jgi:peptide/nickel transport system permease protein
VNNMFTPPGRMLWLGTDEYGRDLLSRLLYGARISLYVGLLAVGLGTTTGALLGLVSGYFRGKTDFLLQRLMDWLMAFPTLVLALAIVAALGQSTVNVILAVAVVIVPTAARVIRAAVLTIREQAFVEAGRAIGCSDGRLLFQHILPNCLASYLILATAGLGNAILAEAALSFLGLGTPPPRTLLGHDAERGGPAVCVEGALDGDLSWSGDQPGRLRF